MHGVMRKISWKNSTFNSATEETPNSALYRGCDPCNRKCYLHWLIINDFIETSKGRKMIHLNGNLFGLFFSFFSFSSFFLSALLRTPSRECFRQKKMRCHASWKYVVIIHMGWRWCARECESKQKKKSTNYLELFAVNRYRSADHNKCSRNLTFFLLLTSVGSVLLEMGEKSEVVVSKWRNSHQFSCA